MNSVNKRTWFVYLMLMGPHEFLTKSQKKTKLCKPGGVLTISKMWVPCDFVDLAKELFALMYHLWVYHVRLYVSLSNQEHQECHGMMMKPRWNAKPRYCQTLGNCTFC